MPARFNLSGIRDYLMQTWGLGPSRQASVMLFAMTKSVAESSGRLPSAAAAKELLNAATTIYADSCGLILQEQSPSIATQQRATTAIDSSVLERFSQEQRLLATLQHKTLASYLGIGNSGHVKLSDLEKMQQSYQERLDLWSSEFGAEFELGIKPGFNPKHLRHFNFSWNQARVEVYKLYSYALCKADLLKHVAFQNGALLQQLTNKSTTQTLKLVQKLINQSIDSSECTTDFAMVGENLTEMISAGLLQPPKATFSLPVTRPRTEVEEDGSTICIEVPRFDHHCRDNYASLLKSGMNEYCDASGCFAGLRTQEKGRWKINTNVTAKFFETMSRALNDGISFSKKVVLITGAGNGSIGAEIVRKLLMGGAVVIVTTSRAISEAQILFRKIYSDSGARGSELFVLPFNQGSMQDCKDLIDYIYGESGLGRSIDVMIPFAAMSEQGIEVDQLESRSELAHRLMLVNVLRLIGCIIRRKTEANIHCCPTKVLLPLSPNHGTFGGDGLYSESKLGLESLLKRFSSESWGDKVSICGVIIGWTRGTGLMESNDILAETIESHGALTFSQEEMALNILTLLAPSVGRLYEDEPIIADFGGGLQCLEGMKRMLTVARSKIAQEAEIKKATLEENTFEESTINGSSLRPKSKNMITSVKDRSTLKIEFPKLPCYDSDLDTLRHLQGMVDLSSTIVIVGFSELGPWGNSRTRWQMESQRRLTQAGYIELAWMMGLIRHFDGDRAGGYHVGWIDAKTGEAMDDHQIPKRFGEHILSHTGIRLIEPELLGGYDPDKKEYLQEIAIEDDLPEFDATLATAQAFKLRHGEGAVIRQLEEPDSFRVHLKAGTHIMVPKAVPLPSSVVAGLLPSGWDAAKYGIPDDIVSQVDTVTLYLLCCVSEAFFSAGIEDPMEVYKYFHLSEIGNFLGTSMGGTVKTRELYRDVHHDKQVQGDLFQETNLNTPAAWVNMLLLGGSGPIKTPVGACATSLESMDIGSDSIISGKTKMCLVGGVDNFHEDESYGFSTMKATVDTAKEFAQGRKPAEMSRPTAKSRAGFVESQGCGVQIICSAEIALKMGLPIYAIVGGSTMAADKISRSVPAPGQGILTFARESADAIRSPLLNIDYRREQMKASINQLLGSDGTNSPATSTSGELTPAVSASDESGSDDCQHVVIRNASPEFIERNSVSSDSCIETTLNTRINAIRRQWGNQFRNHCPTVSPMRAALAVWNLTIDDIDVASLHGTSTKANDINEPDVINKQMNYLGRKGAPLLAICQKSITGHPKGPAAAWMLNGCLQVMNSGLVPGNFNCDNIDPALEVFEHLLYPAETIQTKEVKAFLLTTFGFGQKGGQMIGIAPKYLFATLNENRFEEYAEKCSKRKRSTNRAFAKAVMSNSILRAQPRPPYKAKDETKVLLDPLARPSTDPRTHEIHFDPSKPFGDILPRSKPSAISTIPSSNIVSPTATPLKQQSDLTSTALAQASLTKLLDSISPSTSILSIGIDLESIETFTSDSNPTFLTRNYTDSERDFATQSRDSHATFVSRWCAKEAVFKSLGVKSRGAGAPMKEIEVWTDAQGVPRIRVSARLHNNFLLLFRL